MRGERPKTPQQRKFIDVIHGILGPELKALSVKGNLLEPDRIHFLPPSVYDRDISSSSGGVYYGESDSAVIRLAGRGQTLSMLAEEMLHGASYQSLLYSQQQGVLGVRIGYELIMPGQRLYQSLNEGIINIWKRQILAANLSKLRDSFHLSDREVGELLPTGFNDLDYPFYRSYIHSLISGIGLATGRSIAEIHRQFYQGLFMQEPPTFDLISRVWGEDMITSLADRAITLFKAN